MRRLVTVLLATMPAFAGTVTNAAIGGFDTTTISGSANAYYIICGISPCADPNFISASASAIATTLGPVRNGFIQFSGNGGGEFGSGSFSVGGYSFQCGEFCPINQNPLPFTLGVPFEVNVSANAHVLGGIGGSGVISFQFSVFESILIPGFSAVPGSKIVVFDPPSVPEPATFIAVGLGLLSLVSARSIFTARRS
jgi:PEP-CTERM motif